MAALLPRILNRGRKIARSLADSSRRNGLRTRQRPPRSALMLGDLETKASLVVMAHPDDEAIAAGVLLGKLPRAGVICMTDGAPRTGNFARNAGFDNWMDYAGARHIEAATALALLGREITPNCNLGIADQEAAFNLVPVTRYLVRRIRSGFTHIITHAYEGGHPDHDAAAFCVHAACALIAKEGGAPPIIVEAPLYNAPNGEFEHNKFLPDGDAGPVMLYQLSADEQELKRRMFACHATQRSVFESFTVLEEKFRHAPRYHFTELPHPGDAGYNQYMRGFNGAAWRRHAWRAMRELGVLEELA